MLDRQDTKDQRKMSANEQEEETKVELFDDEDIRSLLLAERVDAIFRGHL